MNTRNSTKHPDRSRLDGIDLARFIALIGMVIVNFHVVMVTPDSVGRFLPDLSELLQGRAAATFVVLAGLGLGLGAVRGSGSQTIAPNLKRAIFLLALGLLNMLIFSADIIHYYAFYFLFGTFFLRSPIWLLFSAMIALTIGFVAMVLSLEYDTGWNWIDYTYSGFWTPTGFIRNLFFNGWHPVFPWLAFLLFGVWLSRLSLHLRTTKLILLATGSITYALTMLVSHSLMAATVSDDPEDSLLFSTAPVPPMPLFVLAGCSIASATLGLCLLLQAPLRQIKLLPILTATGRQTLTLYMAHILIGMGTLEALGYIGTQTPDTALLASAIFCLAAIVFSNIWSRFFKRGPLEWLMRKIAG